MRKALEKIAAKYTELKQELSKYAKLAEVQNLIISEIRDGIIEAEDADARLVKLMNGNFEQLKIASEVGRNISEASIAASSNSFSAEDAFVANLMG